VVLSIRADFLDRVAEDRRFFGELTQGLFFLGPPTRAGLRAALASPAELAGFQLEPAIVDDMLARLEAAPGALPLLQFTAARLWDTRDRARRLLAHASYAAMGGVAGALASHADRVVSDIGPQRTPLVRAILLRLVTAARTRAIVPLDELRELSREAGEVPWLIDQLVDARLLVVQTLEGGAGSTVELVHESLVHGWPALRRWLDEHQGDAALVEQLRPAARRWAAKGRDPGLLWRGDTADEVRKLQARYEGPLSDVERAFVAAVVDHDEVTRRRRRALMIGRFALGLLFVVGALALAIVFQRQAATISRQNQELQEHARKLQDNAGMLEDAYAEALLSKEAVEKNATEARAAEAEARRAEAVARKAKAEAEQAKAVAVAARNEAVRLRDEERRRRQRAEQLRGPTPDWLPAPPEEKLAP
jgi:hypothetical protein